MFKKLYLLNLITVIHIFGAASSNDTGDKLFALSLQFSPAPIKALAVRLANHSMPLDESCDRALLVGKPGTGKSTLAQALGESSRGRVHRIRGTELNGDKYIRSGQVAINTQLAPVIDMAKDERQVVIIDEFDSLIMADEREADSKNRVAHFWQILDDMLATRNIFFVGTCNKTVDFPTPLENRLPKRFRHHIGLPSISLRTAALKYKLNIDADDTTYNATIDRAVKNSDGLSVRSLTIAAGCAKATAIGRGAEKPSLDELLTALQSVRPEEDRDGLIVRAGKRSLKFLTDNKDTITVVTSLAGLGLGAYQHHQSVRRQEMMQLQLLQFNDDMITRNENFTRQMQDNMQAWQKKSSDEQTARHENFTRDERIASQASHKASEERSATLSRELHAQSLQNASQNTRTSNFLGLSTFIISMIMAAR